MPSTRPGDAVRAATRGSNEGFLTRVAPPLSARFRRSLLLNSSSGEIDAVVLAVQATEATLELS